MQTIFYFRRTCFFGNAAPRKGGDVGAALALRVKRELMEVRSLYYIARGLPCPSNEVRAVEGGEVELISEGFGYV